MVRCVFSDFDQFADAISGLDGRYIPTARSDQPWWIDPMRIGRLRLQQLQVGAPSTFAGDGEAFSGLTVGIPLTNPAAIRIDGEALQSDSFILIRHDRPLTYSAQDVTRWAGVTVPLNLGEDVHFKDAVDWSAAMLSQTSATANTSVLRRVSLLVALLCSGSDSINVDDPAALAAAEEEILIATGQLLRSSTCMKARRVGRPRVMRDVAIAKCLEHCRNNVGQPILVADLCRVAEISERTLRNVFYEYFGVGPVRFLKARQLQETRSALMKASAAETVAQIAARFGVWDLSLFARNYRALYGESPSDTLRSWRPLHDVPAAGSDLESVRSWMNYASRRFVARVGLGSAAGISATADSVPQ
jgi:AraC family transcriptional regulator, ethanolamine operon transcriptional activator